MRNRGELAGAAGEFQRAQMIDPSSPVADQELRKTVEMIAEKNRATDARQERPPIQTTSNCRTAPEIKPLSRLYQFEDVRGCKEGLRYDPENLLALNSDLRPDFLPGGLPWN